MRVQERWPWQPLEQVVRARLGPPVLVPYTRGHVLDGATDPNVAALLGCSARQVCRWRACGQLTTTSADRAAVALGLHPALIWLDWYTDRQVAP